MLPRSIRRLPSGVWLAGGRTKSAYASHREDPRGWLVNRMGDPTRRSVNHADTKDAGYAAPGCRGGG